MVVSSPLHVSIMIYDKTMSFGITYRPDTDFVFISDLNLTPEQLKNLADISWHFENLKQTDQIEVYTGNLRLHGILFIGRDPTSLEPQLARTLLIPAEEDGRFLHLKNKVIEMVSKEEYDMWYEFDSATRLIAKEKELFDMTISLFRSTVLENMIREVEFLKTITDHTQFEWKAIDYSKSS